MENDKLIAEFMCWTPCDTHDNTMYANPQDESDAWSTDEMRFNESWDWLMPVVQKCRLDGQNLVGIDNWSEIGSALEECNIDNTYQAVVEFIKTYNDEEQE